MSRARLLVGVHGQGITNGQFMGDDGMVVELFYPHHWRSFDMVGHQPLYRGAGRPYMAAPLAESSCSMMEWKHNPKCPSYVNTSRLEMALNTARRVLGHAWPAAGPKE